MDKKSIERVIRHFKLEVRNIWNDIVTVYSRQKHEHYKFKLKQLGDHTWSMQPIPRVVNRIEYSTYVLNTIGKIIEDLYGTERLEYATIVSLPKDDCLCQYCRYLSNPIEVNQMCSIVTMQRFNIMGEFMTHEDMAVKLPESIYWNGDLKLYRIVNWFNRRVGEPRGTGMGLPRFPIESNTFNDMFKMNLGFGQLPMYRSTSGHARIYQKNYYGSPDYNVELENQEYMIKKLYEWVAQTDFKEV
ncbi:hypothetical protein D5b_00281 [Faustovirus]|nr:hypothetical protein D5b_00281 [Faustovirus]AMN84631.1 hypothetical protein D6_00228 [Faustovirus]AMP44233.1 hypothetical protein PRJ_Dakar_00278 [Faustovirus]